MYYNTQGTDFVLKFLVLFCVEAMLQQEHDGGVDGDRSTRRRTEEIKGGDKARSPQQIL